MRQQAPNVIWRTDITVQRVVRDSSVQANPVFQEAAHAASWWGGPGVVWFGAVLWLGARTLKRQAIARVGLRGVEALAIASGLSGIIKGLAGRARPFVATGEPWHWEFNRGWSEAQFFSMPSGHTTATTACVVAMALALTTWRPATRWFATIPLLATAILVAFARLYTDQHWLSDVVAAMLLGSATALLLARLHRMHPSPRYERVMLGGT